MSVQPKRGLPLDALLVGIGLAIQLLSLPRSHPLTFTLFMLGAAVTAVGSLLFVWKQLRQPRSTEQQPTG